MALRFDAGTQCRFVDHGVDDRVTSRHQFVGYPKGRVEVTMPGSEGDDDLHPPILR